MKTLKDFMKGYRQKSDDLQKEVDKLTVDDKNDAAGNKDDVFCASKVKTIKRKATRHGYEPGEDEGVYEQVEDLDELSGATLGSYVVKSKKDEKARQEHGIKVRDELRKATGKNFGTPIDPKLYGRKMSRSHNQQVAINKMTGKARVNANEEFVDEATACYADDEKKKMITPDDKNKLLKVRAMLDAEKKNKPVKEEVESIDEISHATRSSWVSATWKKHLGHVDDKPGTVKPEMPKARQKVFNKAMDKVNKHHMQDYEDKQRAKRAAHTPQVHDLRHMSHGEVYDHTQTSDKIKDGDVLRVKGGTAAMIGAHPAMVHGKSDVLHHFSKGSSIHNIDDGTYHRTGKLADKVHGLKEEAQIDEKHLTPAELTKREEIAKAIAKKNPGMPMGKKMAIATATAKKVAEEVELEEKISDEAKDVIRKTIKATGAKAKPLVKLAQMGKKTPIRPVDEATRVSNSRYMRSHGKNPSGTGGWIFTHKETGDVDLNNSRESHMASGKYADAAKSAKVWAKKHGHTTVYVAEHVEDLGEDSRTPQEKVDHAIRDHRYDMMRAHSPADRAEKKEDHKAFLAAMKKKYPDVRIQEEVEGLDELSKGKLATYIHKAEDSADDLERKAIKGDDKSWRKMHKRLDSTLKAKHKWITKEDIINRTIEKYMPEDYVAPSLEERFLSKVSGLNESHVRTLVGVFNSISEDNQARMVDMAESMDGINSLLDFALNVRGE